ncbi:MAG TPA: NAD(P)-dependent oxidoreductase [Mucilaginibacter sp.]|nr:NAD(P)-dependent oxidoreductase [Mucilaginibacter sp.]
MKVVAYSVKSFEKEYLVRANQKKHDITLISNPLSAETAMYAEGKDAVVIGSNDNASAQVIDKLGGLGVKYIATRSVHAGFIDKDAAEKKGIKLANVPSCSPHAIAEHAVALALALDRKLPGAATRETTFDFRNEELMGFNLYGKTVGIVGMGHIGLATAIIFKGFGCKVLGYDINLKVGHDHVPLVPLDEVLAQSDIISLHAPLTKDTRGMINKSTLTKMKDGVMIINTASAALMKSTDVLNALDKGKVGYLGMDIYEFERNLFSENHKSDEQKDQLLKRFADHPNVLITPQQACLTREAQQEIANQTIHNLDMWQEELCLGDACIGTKKCSTRPDAANTQRSHDNLKLLP